MDVHFDRVPSVTLVETTGHRIGAVLGLQRRDIDFSRAPHGWIRFRGEHQKNRRAYRVPITKECRKVVRSHLRRIAKAPDAWLFPSEHAPTEAVDIFRLRKLLRKGYRRAGLKTLEGGLWHPFRRKWATERKHLPLKDVAEAGGWRDPNTLLTCYQQSDEATLTRVALEPGKLHATGIKKGAV